MDIYLDILKFIDGLFDQVQLDESRTCIFWNEYIDLASDTLYEYGIEKCVVNELFIDI